MSMGTDFPGLSDPTRNKQATEAILKEKQEKRRARHLRPWEEKVTRWGAILLAAGLAGYALWQLLS